MPALLQPIDQSEILVNQATCRAPVGQLVKLTHAIGRFGENQPSVW
jgi:hypothetical protein